MKKKRPLLMLGALGILASACSSSSGATEEESSSASSSETEVEEGALVGLNMPTSASFDDSGGVYVSEVQGAIKYAPALGEPATEIGRVPARFLSDHGFTSVSYTGDYLYATYMVDPEVESMEGVPCDPKDHGENNGEGGGCPVTARFSRFPVTGPGSLGEEEIVLGGFDDYCAQWPSHGIDDVLVGPDGFLYVSAGEGASAYFADTGVAGDPCGGSGSFRAQSTDFYQGAVVRVDPANPEEAEVVAMGLRNPFRLAWQDADTMLIADVGWDDWEEVNRFDLGGDTPNFGWPCSEGGLPTKSPWSDQPECQQADMASFTQPVLTYEQTEEAAASITAVNFYDGRIVFGDMLLQTVWSAAPDGSDVQVVSQGESFPIDLVVHDEQLYLLDMTQGTLRPFEL